MEAGQSQMRLKKLLVVGFVVVEQSVQRVAEHKRAVQHSRQRSVLVQPLIDEQHGVLQQPEAEQQRQAPPLLLLVGLLHSHPTYPASLQG